MAMDYLPDTAKVLIEKDIQNAHQVDEKKENAVSVKSMLASILGLGDKKNKKKIPTATREPITTTSITPKPLKPEDYVTPTFLTTVILPQKKPDHSVKEIVFGVIDFVLDKNILASIKEKTSAHANKNHVAEVSVGPVAEAENMQLASLQAMAKANSIAKKLKNDFASVSIKFDPLLPRDTLKIVIKGKKRNA